MRVGKSHATAILGTQVPVVFFKIPVPRPAREVQFILVTVIAFVLFAVQSKEEPVLVASPVIVPIVRAVCRAVAVQALPVTLVWSPVLVPERLATAPFASMALDIAQFAIAVAFPVLVTGQVRLALVVTVAAFQVTEPAIGFVTSMSTNHHFFQRIPVLPISSVLFVSEISEVFIATLARFDRAVLAPPLAGASRAREPSGWTVNTSPSLPPEKFISSALAVIVPEAISDGCRAESAKAPCAVVATARSPLPRRVVEFTVLIFVPDTRVACLVSRPVFKRFTVGYFVVLVSIVVFSLFATFSGTYPIFHSSTDQLLAVCHGVSVKDLRESPIATGTPPRVPATLINQKSHFRIAPAVPEPPVEGNTLPEAS